MASGQSLWNIDARAFQHCAGQLPAPDVIEGLETPAIRHRVLGFSGSADEHADVHLQMPSQYTGAGATGVSFRLRYAPDGASATQIDWRIRLYKLADLDDLDTDLGIDTRTAASINDTPSATDKALQYASTTGTLTHAQIGSPVAHDEMILRVTRLGSTDSNNNVALFRSLIVFET